MLLHGHFAGWELSAYKSVIEYMQSNHQTIGHQNKPIMRGGRVASSALRSSQALCEETCELEEDFNRYELLLLVKRAGKIAGFSPRMISLLDYYFSYVRDSDFHDGQAIVYQSVTKTALDMGVSERQIQNLESALLSAGAISFHDSGNHKRYGQRCSETGRIVYAYGINLMPLVHLANELSEIIEEKQLYDQAWLSTKRQISSRRRDIRALLAEWELEEGADLSLINDFAFKYDQIAIKIRTHIKLDYLRGLLSRHEALLNEIMDRMGVDAIELKEASHVASMPKRTPFISTKSEKYFSHYKYSNQLSIKACSPKDICIQKSVVEPTEPKDLFTSAGLQHITLKQVLLASSERFREHLPLEPRPMNWNDVVEAAYLLKSQMHISQKNWATACDLLGRNGAAICVLIVDQAMQRSENPVRHQAAYFKGMLNRAGRGDLKLHNSIFGLMGE